MPGNDQSTMRVLQAAAYVVVVAWGIKTASHILSIIFIALLLTLWSTSSRFHLASVSTQLISGR